MLVKLTASLQSEAHLEMASRYRWGDIWDYENNRDVFLIIVMLMSKCTIVIVNVCGLSALFEVLQQLFDKYSTTSYSIKHHH